MSATITETYARPAGQPDIAYTPNLETYQARVRRRQETEDLAKTLPDGFPQKLESDLVWEGDTVSEQYQWSYQLNDDELAEIHQALKHFEGVCPYSRNLYSSVTSNTMSY
jgi:hypothetical protein